MSYECIRWARSQHLKGPSQAVLVSLSHFVNDQGQCWPSYHMVSLETGLSVKTVQRAIQKLEELKLIKIIRHQYKNGNTYVFPKSYPQEDRSQSPYSKKSQVKLRERQVTLSRETGQSDLRTTKNYYKESILVENQEVQEMYKSNPTPLGDLIKKLKPKEIRQIQAAPKVGTITRLDALNAAKVVLGKE